jgi:hypothetical protein
MKLAKKAFFVIALTMLALVFTMSAQTLRSDKDPRNLAPTVGTGGPPGGPTGLFTVYDGQTLRRGEFTFSAAYSNFDRDPGNVDLTEVPVSFQFGLSDNLELWFNTDAYRAVKVNSPRNLSSFYLPNVSLNINGVVTRAPAIVLAPRGPGTPQFTGAIFRPTGAPFVSFPFDGGPAGNFGLFFPAGPVFGFGIGTQPTLGGPNGGDGRTAGNFPGVGSIYGSILPGVVLQTVGEGSANCPTTSTVAACQAPTIFSLAPSYLPDAPFIGRQYGESAFNTFTVGAKWRFTGPNNPVGFGIIPFYRFYADQADSVSGFNQLQRGASPGGKFSRGDIGLVLFADARLRKWINISANVGYIYNSSVKGEFSGGTFTILDRPDEFISAIGIDFPVNKYFQPILEFRSLQYVGGRTPNAFENSPIDGLAGARIFPTRWFSLGAAYRYHFNQQDEDSFGDNTSTLSTTVVGRIPSTITTTFTGVPPGFATSNDPHGFILQITAGRRNRRQAEIPNIPPNVNTVTISERTVTIPCPPGYRRREGAVCSDDMTVNVSTSATDAENDVLTYNYTVSGGRIVGTGANVSWDLTGVQPGTYTVVVGVDDGCGVCGTTKTETITVARCDCEPIPPECPTCPPIDVTGPSGVTNPGDTMSFTASVSGNASNYNWSVSQGEIISGQGTPSITVQTTRDMQGGNVTATVNATVDRGTGCDACQVTDSETAPVAGIPTGTVTEQGPGTDDEVKAYVDGLYVSLNNNPDARGYIINYGTNAQIARREAQIRKAIAFRKYDINRITMVRGGESSTGTILTKYYVLPAGAETPTP